MRMIILSTTLMSNKINSNSHYGFTEETEVTRSWYWAGHHLLQHRAVLILQINIWVKPITCPKAMTLLALMESRIPWLILPNLSRIVLCRSLCSRKGYCEWAEVQLLEIKQTIYMLSCSGAFPEHSGFMTLNEVHAPYVTTAKGCQSHARVPS